MNRAQRESKKIKEKHDYLLEQINNYPNLIVIDEARNNDDLRDNNIKAQRKTIKRCEAYLYYYENERIYSEWYKRIKELVDNNKKTDFLTGVLKRQYQLRAEFLCFQNSKYILKFREAFFSTQHRKNIYSLIYNSVGEDLDNEHFNWCYVTEEGERDFSARYIDDQLKAAMNRHIIDIDDINTDDLKITYVIVQLKKGKSKYRNTIVLKSLCGENETVLGEYELLAGNALSVYKKIWTRIRRDFGSSSFVESSKNEENNEEIELVFDFQGKRNRNLTKIMQYIAWADRERIVYSFHK